MSNCEYQCPYFKDVERKCPSPSGLEPIEAIEACAKKVSEMTLNSPSGVERDAMAAEEIASRSSLSLWGLAMDREGTTRHLEKVGIPQESDLEL